ncbi:MAG: hypothetical protein GXP15_02860 [Gammaproteobacteria bacterium]|nr:hypothetical protein [Gammaproteobacteria bacterium]
MQRFLKWLGMKLFPKKPEPRQRLTGIRPKSRSHLGPPHRPPGKTAKPRTAVLDTELQGRIEDGGPGKNVLIRNKYVRENTGTHDALKIIDESVIETGEEAGFDPYNTGRFDRSQNWNSRTGK